MDEASVSYLIDGDLFLLRMKGEYAPSEIKKAFLEGIDRPDFPGRALFLFDVSGSDSLAMRSPDDLRDMAAFLASHADRFGAQFAISAGPDVNYGLMRMAQVYSESSGVDARVFRTVDEAKSWLRGDATD